MLILKRANYPYEFYKCKISEEVIRYGDFYYEDDENGDIIKADTYKELQNKREKDEFDSTLLNNATSERDYQKQLKQYEKDYLKETILDKQRLHKGAY